MSRMMRVLFPARHRPASVVLLIVAFGLAGCGGDDQEQTTQQTGSGALVPQDSVTMTADPEAGAASAAEHPEAMTPAAGREIDAATAMPQQDATGDEPGETTAATARPTAPGTTPAPTTGIRMADGKYSIQCGSFRSGTRAEDHRNRIRTAGYEADIQSVVVSGLTYHRVVVRGFADRESARSAGETLRSELGLDYLIKRAD